MKLYRSICLLAVVLLAVAPISIEAKRGRKNKDDSRKTKTKTKWSSSTDLSSGMANSMVATEEHGYYVKRTFLPSINNTNSEGLQSPPYLAIPIAWFSGDKTDGGQKSNSAAINSAGNALSEGFLCDDDCVEAYEPICGKTTKEVAVFYNQCKLNVAKCRTHGAWSDLAYDECRKTYPKETTYADKKFRASPYFRDTTTATTTAAAAAIAPQVSVNEEQKKDKISDVVKVDEEKIVPPKFRGTKIPVIASTTSQVDLAALDKTNNKPNSAELKEPSSNSDNARLKYEVGH